MPLVQITPRISAQTLYARNETSCQFLVYIFTIERMRSATETGKFYSHWPVSVAQRIFQQQNYDTRFFSRVMTLFYWCRVWRNSSIKLYLVTSDWTSNLILMLHLVGSFLYAENCCRPISSQTLYTRNETSCQFLVYIFTIERMRWATETGQCE